MGTIKGFGGHKQLERKEYVGNAGMLIRKVCKRKDSASMGDAGR